MGKFIEVTDVTWLANTNFQGIKEPEKIILNSDNFKVFSTEKNRYQYNDKVCTIIRTLSNDWGFIVTETIEEIQNLINS